MNESATKKQLLFSGIAIILITSILTGFTNRIFERRDYKIENAASKDYVDKADENIQKDIADLEEDYKEADNKIINDYKEADKQSEDRVIKAMDDLKKDIKYYFEQLNKD